jgi:broad specificity phosphatase PhoE
MAVSITYFPHGTTTDNEQGIASGWNDPALSEEGIQQSIALRSQIGDKKFDVIFCSDLSRAKESARLAFEGMALIIPDARLRECNYGDLNSGPGFTVGQMQERMITARFPDGESYEDVKIRIADFLRFLKQNYDGKSVAIVAHKAPQLSLEVLLKGKTWERAFSEDWRKTKSWQPGWEYEIN